MEYVYNDGGRAEAGYKGYVGDCAVRSICIITGKPYQEVYDGINLIAQREKITKKKKSKSTARSGVYRRTFKQYAESLGFRWTPTMFVGSGCKVHLRKEELPAGRIIVNVSKHYVAVIDGVIHDTFDPSREGKRCVYGYWTLTEGEIKP